MYRELRRAEVPVDLAGAVVWQRTADGAVPEDAAPLRILPDGCLDIIWSDGELIIAGPDTEAHLTPLPDRNRSLVSSAEGSTSPRYVGVRFPAGLGPGVLGAGAAELRDARVPLAAVWPDRAVRQLTEQMAAGPDRIGPLVSAVAARLVRPDPVVEAIWHRLRAGSRVDSVADAVGLSPRQLHRRCLHSFGYGPKTLARVLRFDRALALARTGAPPAMVAVRLGYADQAHLSREVRAFAGVPLGTLLAEPPDPSSASIGAPATVHMSLGLEFASM